MLGIIFPHPREFDHQYLPWGGSLDKTFDLGGQEFDCLKKILERCKKLELTEISRV